jgi:hypothetical protein
LIHIILPTPSLRATRCCHVRGALGEVLRGADAAAAAGAAAAAAAEAAAAEEAAEAAAAIAAAAAAL